MKKFIIECRYETMMNDGKKFTNWFVYDSNPMDESEANDIIKQIKETFDYIDKKTKLKHEYRLASYNEYIENQNTVVKEAKKSIKQYEKYLKSDDYKELKRKKRKSSKERKERQKKYLESINK